MNKTKLKIIKKTINLYNREGFNIPIKKIIEHSNVSNGSFFHFFKKKENLSEEIFSYIKSDFQNNINIDFKESEDFINKFEKLFNEMVDWGTKNKEFFLFLLKFKNNKNKENNYNILFYTFNKFIEIGMANNYFKKIDSILLTNISVSTLSHIIFYLYDNQNENKEKYFVLFLDFLKIENKKIGLDKYQTENPSFI